MPKLKAQNKNYSELQKFCQAQGTDLFGVADISAIKNEFMLSENILHKLSKAVCLALSLSAAVLEEILSSPTRLYFHHYKTVNAALDQIALKAANFIQKKDYFSLPIPASQILDWQKQKAHLSHKKLAVLAGLGWIGRNNLLVNERLGSQFRLVSILTDMPLVADRPLKKDCGECRICVKICPAQAIKEDPSGFDHLRCFEKLKEFQKERLVDQYICGVCVKACKGS